MKKIIIFPLLMLSLSANASVMDKIKNFFTYPGINYKKSIDSEDSDGQSITSINEKFYKDNFCIKHYPFSIPLLPEEIKNDSIFICKDNFEIIYSKSKKMPIYSISTTLKENYYKVNNDLLNSIFLVNPKLYLNDELQFKNTLSIVNTVSLKPKTKILYNQFENWLYEKSKKMDMLRINSGFLFLNEKNPNEITHFYKLIMEPTIKETLVIIVPNSDDIVGRNCKNESCNIFSFTTNMNELEKLTKIKLDRSIPNNDVIRFKTSDYLIKYNSYSN